MALQLTAQNGNDGGDLGHRQTGLIEEKHELGQQLCLVGYFSIPGSFPGGSRTEAVKAFTGMNQICCVSAKKAFQAWLVPGPSDTSGLLATRQDAVRHPSGASQPSVRVAGACAPCPFQSPETAFKDKPSY